VEQCAVGSVTAAALLRRCGRSLQEFDYTTPALQLRTKEILFWKPLLRIRDVFIPDQDPRIFFIPDLGSYVFVKKKGVAKVNIPFSCCLQFLEYVLIVAKF
jgi:hypothetical protein